MGVGRVLVCRGCGLGVMDGNRYGNDFFIHDTRGV